MREWFGARSLTSDSLGGALTDTLDHLITERRIEPQLAMKILTNFDKAVADVLADKVKARLTFKVCSDTLHSPVELAAWINNVYLYRATSIPTASATTSGPSLSKTSTSSSTTRTRSTPTASRSSAATPSVRVKLRGLHPPPPVVQRVV
jgi:hypothetical protein